MKKQLLTVLALILLFSALFGCSNALPTETAKTTSAPAASSVSTESSTEKTTAKITSNVSTSTNKSSTSSTTKATTAKTTSTIKATSTTAKTTAKQTTAKPSTTKKKQTATQAESCCYITVECKSVLKKMDKLKEGHEEFVPSNGIIISKTKCAFEDSDSVYDVLEKVCKNKGVKLTSRNTTYGVYVSGINNLDEFDCGKQSGWVYTVNGSSPAYSCGKYTVKEKNEIVFKYVC